MSENSGIQWTHHTFNPWWGCTRVSPGCQHCYAETLAKRFGVGWGPKGERRLFGDKHWNEPRKWNAKAAAAGERHRVFCASMADVFEDRPELAPERAKLFRLIQETPHLDWLLLTKRPENAVHLWSHAQVESSTAAELGPMWLPNIWIGVTAEDQQRAEERIPILLSIPAAVRFVSYEPALGPVDFSCIWFRQQGGETLWNALRSSPPDAGGKWAGIRGLDWIIVGGESGHSARPFRVEWARNTIAQCRTAGVAAFFKQTGRVVHGSLDGFRFDRYILRDGGEWEPPIIGFDRARFERDNADLIVGFKPFDVKGGDWLEWPEDLRVREFPR